MQESPITYKCMYYNFAALPTDDLKLYEGEEKHTTSLYSSNILLTLQYKSFIISRYDFLIYILQHVKIWAIYIKWKTKI